MAKKELVWPTRFGKLGEKVFGENDPFNQPTDKTSWAINNYPQDEIKPTKSPITGRYYTSKAALRSEYKAYGAEEIGTAYEHGYEPEKERKRENAELVRKLNEKIIDRYRNGR
jgi:hypothetical protein